MESRTLSAAAGAQGRRLSPEKRRAEIISMTRKMIAEHGPEGLSMRAVARYCGMTGPGIAHHFPSMTALLDAVLKQRNEEYVSDITRAIEEHGEKASLLLAMDTFVRYFAARPVETRNFDRLEAEAMNPNHPAHSYYVAGPPRGREITQALAERDYLEPDNVMKILSLVVDGLRSRWLLSPDNPDLWEDWAAVRAPLFNSFKRKDGRPTVPDGAAP